MPEEPKDVVQGSDTTPEEEKRPGDNPEEKPEDPKPEGTGKRPKKRGRGHKRNDKPEENAAKGNGLGYAVKTAQYTDQEGKTEISDDQSLGGLNIKGSALSAVEEGIGYAYIVEAPLTGINEKDALFVDEQKILPNRLNQVNLPGRDETGTGVMKQIDTEEELIAITTLPCTTESMPKYPKNQKVNSDGIITVDDDTTAAVGGQFIGVQLGIKNKHLEHVSLINATPCDATAVGFGENANIDLCADGHLRVRMADKFYDDFKNFEDSKDKGIAKNPLLKTPNTKEWAQFVLDLACDTTAIIEKSLLCASEFITSLNQERYYYGQDINKRFTLIKALVAPILDYRNDAKKINSINDLVNTPFLVDIIDDARKVLSQEDLFLCYPKTTIAYKPELQKLLKWTRISADHRAVYQRNVLAFTTNFKYSDITQVDGVADNSGTGVGGNISRSYKAMEDGNVVPRTIKHPVFDGIQAELDQRELRNHPWNTNTERFIPLTFDPHYPTFAFMVLRSIREIVRNLSTLLRDVKQYLSEGGQLPSCICKYEWSKFESFLNEAGYGYENRHDLRKGRTASIMTDEQGNYRFRFPEAARLLDESSDDDKSFYEYMPGIISGYTRSSVNGEVEFTGRFGFPLGKRPVNTSVMLSIIDPVIAVNNSDIYSLIPQSIVVEGGANPVRYLTSNLPLKNVTVKQWLTSRRLNGLITAIPTGLLAFDGSCEMDASTYSIPSITATQIATNLAKKLTDQSLNGPGALEITDGIQLSSYRMTFFMMVDKVKRVKVELSNSTGHIAYQKARIRLAYSQPHYVSTDGFAGQVIKADGTTDYIARDLVLYPFSWDDQNSESASYAFMDKWGYHAKFLLHYVNPFSRIREKSSVGEDAPTRLVPHQYMTNEIFTWVELFSDTKLQSFRAKASNQRYIMEAEVYTY